MLELQGGQLQHQQVHLAGPSLQGVQEGYKHTQLAVNAGPVGSLSDVI